MKHTDKKTLSLGALALSALLLAGCGDGGGTGAQNEQTTDPAGAATTATAEDTATTEESQQSASATPSGTATADESASATPSGTATADGSATATPSGTATPGSAAGAGAAAAVVGAIAAAEEAVAGGQAFEVDRKDDEEGWEVTLAVGDREREVDVSADGSQATPQERDDELDQEDRERIAQVQVPLQDAVRTALEEVDGTLDGAELDTEDGITVWEVDVDDAEGTSVDVYVNAQNGSVLKVDR